MRADITPPGPPYMLALFFESVVTFLKPTGCSTYAPIREGGLNRAFRQNWDLPPRHSALVAFRLSLVYLTSLKPGNSHWRTT